VADSTPTSRSTAWKAGMNSSLTFSKPHVDRFGKGRASNYTRHRDSGFPTPRPPPQDVAVGAFALTVPKICGSLDLPRPKAMMKR
jgi:hypothetical protein